MSEADYQYPYLATGAVLLLLAQNLESEGRFDEAREMYLRAVEQGLLIRQLKEFFDTGRCPNENISLENIN